MKKTFSFKRLFVLMLILTLVLPILFIPVVAFADTGGAATADPLEGTLFTWEFLATWVGCVAATMVVTQALKTLWIKTKMAIQFLSYLVALLIMVLSNFFLGTLTLSVFILAALNAVGVSFAANGGFKNIKDFVMGVIAKFTGNAPTPTDSGGTPPVSG